MTTEAIIIGAGIGGLSAAIALAKVGINSTIFEKADELRDVGAGIVLYPNALNVVRHLGLMDAVAAEGSFARSGLYMTWNGRHLLDLDAGALRMEDQWLAIHRADLQKVLADAAGRERIRLGHHCLSVREEDGKVSAQFADGSTATGDILIACDGLHSAVRQQLLHDDPPRFASCFAFRGVTTVDESVFPAHSGFLALGRGMQFGACSIGKGRIYWFGAVADKAGHGDRTTKKDVLRLFGSWADPIPALIESTADGAILTHDLFDRDPAKTWGSGRVTLLGDAAHPMVPYMGQGGCQALEDSGALAQALADSDDVVAALRVYEQRRMPRSKQFVLQSRNSQAMTMVRSPLSCYVRDQLIRMTPKAVFVQQMHTLATAAPLDVD